jgi:catalase (peroxidase I)
MNFPDMRLQDENGHLDVAINTLEKIRDNWEQLVTTCINISSADIIQFAGVFATVRQTGPVPGLTTDKISQLLTFKWGRPDEVNCNTMWTQNLPGFQLGTDPEDLPLRCKRAGGEIRKKMINRNGFTTQEATALIGAHTIGLTRNVFGGGLAAPWVASGADSATPTGPVFDNAYFDFLKNKIVAKSITDFDKDTAPFTNMFPTWVQTTSPTKLNYLDTDLILAFPRPVNWTIPDYHLHTTAFVKNNEFFLTTFRNAQTKMGMLGVTANVTVPVPCSMCPSFSDPVDANAVLKLVSDLGTATATADSSLAAQQDANKDQLLVQTTTVVLTSSTTAFVSA